MKSPVTKAIVVATALCGTLDILFAMILTIAFGRQVGNMLRFVASGPFPAATEMGAAGAVLGVVVHFALMATMATVFVVAARARPSLLNRPALAGLAYGLITYFVMNWLIVPLRFGGPLPLKPISIATQLFAHIILVGLPTAFIARRYLRPLR